MTLRAVIVDDEALARQRLRDLLEQRGDVDVVGEASDGPGGVALIDDQRPDVAFLDIEMPGGTGLEVMRQAQHQPLVVFTTAFERYAVTAFELAAVDYLLKPFGPERLETAMRRIERVSAVESPATSERLDQVLPQGTNNPLGRFFVRERGKLLPLDARDVERLEADDDYVRVVAKGRQWLVYLTLNDFEQRLDPQRFLRIHRSHIVNLDFVRHLVPGDGGRLEVEMQDGSRIAASRTRARELRNLTL